MYVLLILLLLIVAAAAVYRGIAKENRVQVAAGVILAVLTLGFFWFMSFWGEVLWFNSVGYGHRFWTEVIAKAALAIIGALLGLLVVSVLTWKLPKGNWMLKSIAVLAAAYIAGRWSLGNWDKILLLINRVSTGVKDPILGRDTGFYLFILPVYNTLYALLLVLTLIALITSAIGIFIRFTRGGIELQEPENRQSRYTPLYLSAACLLFVLAWGRYLDRFGLMYSPLGVVTGPGWTDVHVRLPLYLAMAILMVIAGLVLAVPYIRNKIFGAVALRALQSPLAAISPLVGVAIVTAALWFILLAVAPGLFQWLKVQPNEITLERPYIEYNIEFTRRGFGLHGMEEKRFPVAEEFNQQMIEQNRNLFDNVRLWDYRALDSVYRQFQEIRLYYEFADVDVDRYTIQDRYRQVMVSAREINLSNLPQQSQTFVNERFKYTHGNGITLTTVSEFTPEGLPNLLIKDIPPKSAYPELDVTQPRIYYGELTDTHVIVNSEEKELDYPSGEENVYIRYPGSGGVQISNFWRKFLFGWKFDGTRLLLSGYPTSESRIMFHRQIRERVSTIAPFLKFDDDPYIVLAGGKLYWIIDAYAVSADFPYSEPSTSQPRVRAPARRYLFRRGSTQDLRGINYIRNSVKTVIDAFNGTVSFYIFEPEDPLIQTWAKVFPDLFKARDEMPEELLSHIRYPADMLLIQGLVYAKYHMTDPAVFYNQEDLWVRATEKYYGQTQYVQPYYIMWEPEGSAEAEFILMLPFTPKDKQVLIAWTAGMCDPSNYGRLLAYKFPKEKRVLGTQQVETKIDQDPVLSGQLSLWDQRGSRVIRGNVLVIPIEDTLLYVEPIYLQAETAAYPELRLVAVMHNDNLSYAETFDEALYGLLAEGRPALAPEREKVAAPAASLDQLIQEANEAFENYLNALGNKEFDQSSKYLEELSDSLEKLMKIQAPNTPGTDR